MSELPFPFVADEFYPLQPEDADAEYLRRTLPKYAHQYTNIAELHYIESGLAEAPADASVVISYASWVAACKSMDAECEAARVKWKEAVISKDAIVAKLRSECEELRSAYRTLQIRSKPPQPKSERGNV